MAPLRCSPSFSAILRPNGAILATDLATISDILSIRHFVVISVLATDLPSLQHGSPTTRLSKRVKISVPAGMQCGYSRHGIQGTTYRLANGNARATGGPGILPGASNEKAGAKSTVLGILPAAKPVRFIGFPDYVQKSARGQDVWGY